MASESFADKGCLQRAGAGVGCGLVIGLVASSVLVIWRGPSARITPWKATANLAKVLMPVGAGTGFLFTTTECVLESLRGEKDVYNAGLAGCAAGATMGLFTRRVTTAGIGCVAGGLGMMAVDAIDAMSPRLSAYTGKTVAPQQRLPTPEEIDEFAANTQHLKVHRPYEFWTQQDMPHKKQQ